MNGRKKDAGANQDARAAQRAPRIHNEGLGHVWQALTGIAPTALIPQVVATVVSEGGTRPSWQWRHKGQEFILMAWPQDQPIRAAVLMTGPEGGSLKPATVVPLLEGLPNDLTVEEARERSTGGGDVGCAMLADGAPMWFFDPLFGRDRADLTPGVTHTFWLGAAALGLRKALLDEITITQGEQYEAWAAEWLAAHPGSDRLSVPPLKIDIQGKTMIMPGRAFGEYQIRATVEKVDDCQFDKMAVKIVFLKFPFADREPLRVPLFASEHILDGFVPAPGQEIEAYAWFQGRIIDLESVEPVQQS